MSYLDVPRLHFAGRFGANISTVNNTATNFNPAVTNPRPLFNPDGTGNWTLQACTVTSAVYSDGTAAEAATDPIIGSSVTGNDGRTSAKLVDLDPQQQLVSEVWGLNVAVGTGANAVSGDYEPAGFTDLWPRASQSGGDQPLGALWQSVLKNLQWGGGADSRFLQELAAASPDQLSIKMVVDGFDFDTLTGRVVGTIGPAHADEPTQFVAGRLLRSGAFGSQGTPLYFAPCRVDDDRKVVLLDLGNSIPTTVPGGPLANFGDLQLAIVPAGQDPVLLGAIRYSDQDYTTKALVQEFPVTSEQLAQLKDTPLAVGTLNTPDDGRSAKVFADAPFDIHLVENSDGIYVRADKFVFRLNPGDPTVSVDFWATHFGAPIKGQQIALSDASNRLPAGRVPPNPSVGTPAALNLPSAVDPTDDAGRTSFELSGADPGNPRSFIDGQVYGIGYSSGSGVNPDKWDFVSVLLHSSFDVPAQPVWSDVQPILDQYAKLYPFMSSIVDLSSLTAIRTFGPANIAAIMTLPMTNPGFMPVTRDLSADKTKAIVTWLNNGAPG